ncbi:MAG: hypothetical protein E7360_05940 [Clostridiales bacterium]|nr:hypothetical protein [Clostridiales bacterium]
MHAACAGRLYKSGCIYTKHISPQIIIHRISGDAPKDLLVAPEWNLHKKWIINGINKALQQQNVIQGDSYNFDA